MKVKRSMEWKLWDIIITTTHKEANTTRQCYGNNTTGTHLSPSLLSTATSNHKDSSTQYFPITITITITHQN